MLKTLGHAQRIAEEIKKEVRVVYDIGAHRGVWTKSYLPTFPNASFYLFEPVPKEGRCALDPKRVTWKQVVLSAPGIDEVDFYSLGSGPKSGGNSYYRETTGIYESIKPVKLGACTLDSLDLPPSQVMKLDTQGSELDILKGAERALESALMVQMEMPLMEYNEGAPKFGDYLEFMADHGFAAAEVEEFHYWHRELVQVDLVFLSRSLLR